MHLNGPLTFRPGCTAWQSSADSGDHEPLIHVVIQGHEHVLNELSQHWLFGHTLVKRRDGEAHFQLDTSSLMSYVPYFLLPYGKALTILEPASLVLKLSEITTSMALHYERMLSDMTKRKGEPDGEVCDVRKTDCPSRQTG